MPVDPKAPPPLKSDWVPGGATPAPQPRVVWPRVVGVAVAVVAQLALYAGLHRVSTVTMPAWAHRATLPRLLPWPAVVPVVVIKGDDAPIAGALPSPVLVPPPPVAAPPLPELRLAPGGTGGRELNPP